MHTGNSSSSSEAATRIVTLIQALIDTKTTWVDRDDIEHPLTIPDILVVAPYKLQVQLICEELTKSNLSPDNVGTVDKFQGQQAPVVFYSVTASSADDISRGLDFLFDLKRLNVATSRAQAVAIVVASPRLLEAECKTPEQMRLVNGLCGAVDAAG